MIGFLLEMLLELVGEFLLELVMAAVLDLVLRAIAKVFETFRFANPVLGLGKLCASGCFVGRVESSRLSASPGAPVAPPWN